jgi:hypothetical protein
MPVLALDDFRKATRREPVQERRLAPVFGLALAFLTSLALWAGIVFLGANLVAALS